MKSLHPMQDIAAQVCFISPEATMPIKKIGEDF
jgi:hypothetical protein